MAYDRFMIAPYSSDSGLRTDLKQWIIPDQAFAQLNNAYVWRGRVRKRFGSRLMGNAPDSSSAQAFARLKMNLGTTNPGTGNLAGIVPEFPYNLGVIFYCDGQYFTPTDPTAGVHQMLRTDGSAAVATFNLATGAFNIQGASLNKSVYFFPALPVMGFANYEVGPVNDQPSFAFDTKFAYQWKTIEWVRETTGNPIWHGTDSDFFWTCNWEALSTATGSIVNYKVLFVTNFYAPLDPPAATDDPIWYYDGTTWASFSPYTIFLGTTDPTAPNSYVQTARLIVAFKDRLLLMNTIEYHPVKGADPAYYTRHVNRCRFSHNGSPFATNAWLEPNQSVGPTINDIADGAGWIDATTDEAIISCDFIKNHLIVYFERSTWELVYTGNQVQPFIWQKINTELGAESTFSIVPFDKVVLGISNVGVHACNGANVSRIDSAIPDQIFNIENKSEGVKRIAGIRDYYVEMVYWTFPSTDDPANTYPDKILVYNYNNNTWAYNDDCITAFGYFEQQADYTWATVGGSWEEAAFTWSSGVIEAQFRQIIAGNQEGFTFLIVPDDNSNSHSLQITNVTPFGVMLNEARLTIINHNLKGDDYIQIDNCVGDTTMNGNIYEVLARIDKDNVVVGATVTTGYLGGGTARRVSRVDILTKQFNPYVNQNKNVNIAKVDFLVDRTSGGAFTVDYYPATSTDSMVYNGILNDSILGTGIVETTPYALYPLETLQDRLWHPTYLQANAEAIQMHIYFNDDQMLDENIVFDGFQLHAMTLYTSPAGRLQ